MRRVQLRQPSFVISRGLLSFVTESVLLLLLVHPDFRKPFILFTDVSQTCCEAVLVKETECSNEFFLELSFVRADSAYLWGIL